MKFSTAAKTLGAVFMAGMVVASGKSLMKDVSGLAKVGDISFDTSSKQAADAVSGKNVDYRKTQNNYFNNGERIARRKKVRSYKKQIYIWNNGEMPPNLNSTYKLFMKHSSQPYNPKMANVFFKSGMIEAWVRGFEKIKSS